MLGSGYLSGVVVRIRNIFHSVPKRSTLGIGPVYIAVFMLSIPPSPPPLWRQEVINLTTWATKGGHLARTCFGRQPESRDGPRQSGIDAIRERGGRVRGRRETGDSGGSLAAIFFPTWSPDFGKGGCQQSEYP